MIASVANLYYTLLMLDSQQQVTRETADRWKKSVETMRSMKEAGMTTEAGVAQYEGNYYAIESSLRDLDHQLRQVENSLCSLLGRTPQAVGRGSFSSRHLPREITVAFPSSFFPTGPTSVLPSSP